MTGAMMVMDRAIMPQVPHEVFRLLLGNILSSVNETWVVVMKDTIMPILSVRINKGIIWASNFSLASILSNYKSFIWITNIPMHPKIHMFNDIR